MITRDRMLHFLALSGLVHAVVLSAWSSRDALLSTPAPSLPTIQATLIAPTAPTPLPPEAPKKRAQREKPDEIQHPTRETGARDKTRELTRTLIAPLKKTAVTTEAQPAKIRKPPAPPTKSTRVSETPPPPTQTMLTDRQPTSPTPVDPEQERRSRQQTVSQWKSHVEGVLQITMQQRFRYPLAARKRGWQGVVMLRFVVASSGEILSVELAESSGHATLDRSALKNARRIARVPIGVDFTREDSEIPIDIPVRYQLRG